MPAAEGTLCPLPTPRPGRTVSIGQQTGHGLHSAECFQPCEGQPFLQGAQDAAAMEASRLRVDVSGKVGLKWKGRKALGLQTSENKTVMIQRAGRLNASTPA